MLHYFSDANCILVLQYCFVKLDYIAVIVVLFTEFLYIL